MADANPKNTSLNPDGTDAMAAASNMKLPTGKPLLEVENLRTGIVTERGVVRAVDGVSFTLQRGRTVGIVGESGAGKTMLARSIMGLLPTNDIIREGSVRLDGDEILGRSRKEMRSFWGTEMSMVPQDPMTSLNPVRRIGAQIMEPLRIRLGLDRREAKATALALLDSVRIPDPEKRLREYPHQLSGGMRQRVVIAAALACGPRLLFADEPTTALDVTVQAQILNLLGRIREERHMAIMLVTHDLGVVANHTDEIIVMYAGRVVERAPTKVLFTEMRMPYTAALLASIPRLDTPVHTKLEVISGRPADLSTLATGCRFAPRCQFADQQCLDSEPPLSPGTSEGHEFRCWHPLDPPKLSRPTVAAATAVNHDDAQGV
jgi:oligopeptide/dipeptide ABC transporter ATP-binding protein